MAYTFTETKQDEERASFARTSDRQGVLDNQLDFSSSATTYEPSYSTLYTNTEDEETSAYEVEKEYKIEESLNEDETIVPTFMPTIEKKTSQAARLGNDVKFKLNARGKIIVAVFSIVSVLLLSFCIYNAVLIGNLNAAITSSQIRAEQVTQDLYKANANYNSQTSEENILAQVSGFTDGSDRVVEINMAVRPEITQAKSPSNWFDKICEFVSNLFG